MKVLIYRLLSVVAAMILSACQEEKVPVYMDRDRINFIGTYKYNEDDPLYMHAEKNFLSIQGKTAILTLKVKVQGRPSDTDRRVFFTQRDSTDIGVEMKFGECVVPADSLRGACEVVVTRPSVEEKELISLVGIDYKRSDFDKGTFERQEFTVKIFDKINTEILGMGDFLWKRYKMNRALGDWSLTKARFICRTLGITDLNEWYYNSEHWIVDKETDTFICLDKEVLVEALRKYKADPANPPLYDEILLPEEVWITFG